MSKKFEIGKPIGESDLLTFELPPVSDKETGFIEADPDQNPEDTTDVTQGQDPSVMSDERITSESSAAPHPAQAHAGRLSGSGEPYDPAIHYFPPTETAKTKRWRKKSKKEMENDAAKSTATETPIDAGAEIRRSAENLAFMYANAHQFLYGENGGIKDNGELMPLVTSLERYMQERGAVNINPSLSVVMNAGFYSARVATREENKSKTREYIDAVKGGVIWLLIKARIMKPKRVIDAQPEKRDDKNAPLYSGGGDA